MKDDNAKNLLTIDQVSAMFGVDVWTIRLWINRFKILGSRLDKNDDILFTPEDVKRIESIFRLTKKKGTSLQDVRTHLEEMEENE